MNEFIKNESKGWRIPEGALLTRWAKEVDPSEPLPEYPRPQMVREKWLNLNGTWDYAIRPGRETECPEYDGGILVPFCVESALSGVRRPLTPDDRLWYRRTFRLPGDWRGERVLLHFGAVDWETEVRLNGVFVGEHRGGYCPFSFDVTDRLAEGENVIVIIVRDATETDLRERGKQSLRPKGLFYTAVSGIWQTVWLEPVPKRYIAGVRLTPDPGKEELLVRVTGAGEGQGDGWTIEATAWEQGKAIAIGEGAESDGLKLRIPNPKLWTPDSPYLYRLAIRLTRGGVPFDRVESYFAMRSFGVGEGADSVRRLLLNGEPLFQHGVLDQGYWPDGLYTAPTDEALAYDVEIAKKLGFNMIRKHIKVEPARWYYHCDRLGMIVWQDMPNGGGGWNHWHHLVLPNFLSGVRVKDRGLKALGRDSPGNREQFRRELKEMLDALYSAPSIGAWVPFNEAWGQFDAAEIARWTKEYDPSRPVDHASGWHDQGAGDLRSAHVYFRKLRMPKRIRGRAVAISEYGGYSLTVPGHVWEEGKGFGYKKCRTREELAEAYRRLIDGQLKPLVRQGISAAVYTQLTDVETELNGLLTYDREILKIDEERLAAWHSRLFGES